MKPTQTSFSFTVPGEPASKARPRFDGRGLKSRTYTPAKTKAAEEAVAWRFKAAGGRFNPDGEATYAVDMTFYNGTRQRRDVDNMIKLVLDGLNGVAWVDDTQVMEVSARKRFTDRESARTEVEIRIEGRMDRLTAICEECGAEFITYASWGRKRHCSDDCRLAKRRRARLRACQHCGKVWDPGKPSEAKYCSRECRSQAGRARVTCSVCGTEFEQFRSWIAERNYCSDPCRRVRDAEVQRHRRTKHFPGRCLVCGAGTTRKEYRRCNPCKLAGKQIPS